MSLDKKVIKDFVAAVNKKEVTKTPTILTGTVHREGGTVSVKIDGSESLTPVSTVINVEDGERVTVIIENHKAMITGNLSSPAARGNDVEDLKEVVADKVSTAELKAITAKVGQIDGDVANFKETTTEKLTAQDANIKKIDGDVANFKETTTEKLSANEANIKKIDGDVASFKETTTEKLNANSAAIGSLDSTFANFKDATAEKFKANEASIEDLKTGKLSAKDADLKYANIDFSNIGKTAMEYFYAQSGLVKDVKIGDATITGELVGVTISGDLLKGNTVVADKLVIKGSDGLYYKLNTDGMSVEKEQTDYNSLNGQIIRAKSITATKIDVEDLVAFGATIGGFKIGQDSIYSGVKETVGNTTRGIYMDNDGQFVFGDASQYVKFYKISEGKYKLAIAVEDLFIGSSNVADAIEDIKKTADSAASVASSASSAASTANSTANAAKSTAEGASKTASDAKSTADSASQVASNAAKTATNYMKFDNSGLTVGDLTKNTIGRNVNINSSSVNIRNGSNTLASFSDKLIELGKSSSDASISLLNKQLVIGAEKKTVDSFNFNSATMTGKEGVYISAGDPDIIDDETYTSALSILNDGKQPLIGMTVTKSRAHGFYNFGPTIASLDTESSSGYANVTIKSDETTSQVELRTQGAHGTRVLYNYSHALSYYVDGAMRCEYTGDTPCLWDGALHMNADQVVTLSAPISQQPHGILLVFAAYNPDSGAITNYMTMPCFVPKQAMNYWWWIPVFWENTWQMCTKQLYVTNTQIQGHANNVGVYNKANTDINVNGLYFTLRRVYGV